MDMHMLVKLVFIMAAYQRNIARASDDCVTPDSIPNTVPLQDKPCNISGRIHVKCVEGYVRKAGTSSLFRCMEKGGNKSWCSVLPLKCIPDPRNPRVSSTKTPFSPQHFTSSTTERAARSNTTVHGTSTATTATGHIAVTTTNEVVTSKTRRTTTSLPTLTCTTKVVKSTTTTNEITTSTSSSFTSREYMTAKTSSNIPSGSFTTTTGGNASTTRTTTDSEGDKSGAFSSGYKSTVGGVTGIILLCLIAAVLLLWWRARNRQTNRNNADPNRNIIILTNSVACTSYTSVPQSSPADNSTEDSEIFINQPQCVDT
ncbi:cell wall integrity and stress response component 3 isoform X1 [Carassius auratus]|uniref:Cell wall integrity and stress response component 3 isoform X1 n=1 Tax=Carassius auratus TaxID=7957 RepID=A0A6P6K0S8_CARAU|nr:cell wall integrity and stress response component 3-like isoform X1 [Carassius auratus]